MDNSGESEVIIRALTQAIERGDKSLNTTPGLVKQLLDKHLWQIHIDMDEPESVPDSRFVDFCRQWFPKGLNTNIKVIMRLCEDEPELHERLVKIHRESLEPVAKNGELGNGRGRFSVTKPTDGEPDTDYIISRLKRDDPELAQAVIDNELSPNQAAIRAGIRREYIRVRSDDPAKVVEKLAAEFDIEDLRAIRDGINELLGD